MGSVKGKNNSSGRYCIGRQWTEESICRRGVAEHNTKNNYESLGIYAAMKFTVEEMRDARLQLMENIMLFQVGS